MRDVLGETGARSIPEIVVFNKADLISDDERLVLRGLQPDAIFASARTNEGVDEILARIGELLPRPQVPVSLLLPELDASVKQQLIEQHKLNHHKLRFAMLPVTFNWQEFVQHNHIIAADAVLAISFDGKQKPQVLEGIEINTQRF